MAQGFMIFIKATKLRSFEIIMEKETEKEFNKRLGINYYSKACERRYLEWSRKVHAVFNKELSRCDVRDNILGT